MNRKIAVAAIAAGLVQAVSVLRGQEARTPITRTPRRLPAMDSSDPTLNATLARDTTTTLTRAMVEDLQKQVADLTRRLALVETAQANTFGFTKSGDDFVFAPTTGNVAIRSANGLALRASSTLNLEAMQDIQQRAGTTIRVDAGSSIEQKAAATMKISAGATLEQKAAMITLN